MRRRDDLVITGRAGTGKSHILKALDCALANRASPCATPTVVDLLDDLYAGLADNTYARRLKAWARPSCSS